MNRLLLSILCVVILAFTYAGCSHIPGERRCERHLQQDPTDLEKIDLTDNEKRLVCGDKHLDGWEEIPIAQIERQLRIFLEERGYFTPSFRLDGKTLVFQTGPATRIHEIHFLNAPEEFHGERYRGVDGQNLSRGSLDDIQAWSTGRLRRLGYACGKVIQTGNSTTGDVDVKVSPGELRHFPNVHLIDGFGTEEAAVRRYDAFRSGDRFDSRLLDLSASRIESSGTVVSSVFPFHCVADGGLKIDNGLVPGEKRLVQIGIGATTEEFPIARLVWKNVRLGDYASTVSASLYASPLHQLIQVGWEGHVFPNSQRTALLPQASFENWNESDIKGYEVKAPAHIAHQWERSDSSFRLEAGPTLSYQNISEGVRPGVHLEPVYDGSLDWTSHEAEIYSQDPRNGAQAHLAWTILSDALGSSTDAALVSLTLSKLWNLGQLDPPAWVLGTRVAISTVLTHGADGTDPNLPATFNVVLGGDQDMRGFGRRELPGAGQLSLSNIYWGTEIRRAHWLPQRLEPFLFFDAGWLGRRTLTLDPTAYLSPGFGLRWQSPIGTLRSSLAHGWVIGRAPVAGKEALQHFQLFVSLGKEF